MPWLQTCHPLVSLGHEYLHLRQHFRLVSRTDCSILPKFIALQGPSPEFKYRASTARPCAPSLPYLLERCSNAPLARRLRCPGAATAVQ